ncbi:hypothetical protein [Roseiconus lacunae]|uniref:Secreted Zn-dependent protease n=1 Tax=Roseiconus lacunae TaxID=2605694 RepID=A0ABT7PK36_9BACT|nr:hypothetical protein [Roseiconus lacunae]MDM4016646.1 hypothetical protein [Roseiconus lacunae]
MTFYLQHRIPIAVAWIVAVALVTHSSAIADEATDEPTEQPANDNATKQPISPQRRPTDAVEILLTELPPPPPPIKRLIDQGDVRLITGGEAQTTMTAFPGGGRLAGETRFKFKYRYHSNARWRVIDDRSTSETNPTGRSVRIAMNLRNVRLTQSHDVWLRSPPTAERFWDAAIVKHEFDHVAISSHPKIEQLFRDRLKRLRNFIVPLSDVQNSRGRVDRTRVSTLIDAKLNEALKATTDFVSVRYKELDYQTRHGILPLPPDWQPLPNVNSADE